MPAVCAGDLMREGYEMANVLLIGMGPTALAALESLAEKFHVVGVVRDTDDAVNSVDPVVARAQELAIQVFSDISQAAIERLVSCLKPDCVVVSSYNRILKPKLIAQYPFVNVHYAPLPRYRGRANVNWALINNEPCAAITIHQITPDLDAGNILFQRLIPISNTDNVGDLYEKLNALQRKHLADTIARFLDKYEGIPQRSEEARYCCSRVPADGEIDWTASSRKIDCLVRALAAPFPGAHTYFQGRRLIIWKAEPVDTPPCYVGRVPGRVVGISKSGGYVDVLAGDGILRISRVQFEGEDSTSAAHVLRSVRSTLGLRTADLLERIQVLEEQVAKLMGNRR
jgi:methionyl-tRNA formyltransferase